MHDEPENESADENDRSPQVRQKRGTPFPQVSLPEAAALIKEVGSYGNDHSVAAFASYLGHESANSGAFRQKIAAFRDWKLVSGSGERLSLTELARRIAHPSDDDSEAEALRATFENIPVFVKLYENIAKGRPLDLSSLANQAVTNHGVQPKLKDKFIGSFRESAIAAGLARLTDDGKILFQLPGQPQVIGRNADERTSTDPGADDRAGDARGPQNTKPVLRQSWPLATGEITFEIRSSRALPAAAFAQVARVIAEVETLKGQLGDASN